MPKLTRNGIIPLAQIHKKVKIILSNPLTMDEKTKQITELYSKQIEYYVGINNKIQSENDEKTKQIEFLIIDRSRKIYKIARFLNRKLTFLFPLKSKRRIFLIRLLDKAETFLKFGYFKKQKIDNNFVRLKNFSDANYRSWSLLNEVTDAIFEEQKDRSEKYKKQKPLFSIITPVYKIPTNILEKTINSLIHQSFQNWEACFSYADIENQDNWKVLKKYANVDKRIKIKKLAKNLGISGNSNEALKMAKGEFLVLLDHDDELHLSALYKLSEKIKEDNEIDFLYTDKDCINENGDIRLNPLFKPDWSPEILYSVNYLTHLNAIRTSLVTDVGGWRSKTDGAQDWDIFFRVTEKSRKIARVPCVGYHWRIIEGSTSTGLHTKPYALNTQLVTIQDRLKRLELKASTYPSNESGFHIVYEMQKNQYVEVILFLDKISVNILNIIKEELSYFSVSLSLMYSGLLSQMEKKFLKDIFNTTHSLKLFENVQQEGITDIVLSIIDLSSSDVICFIDGKLFDIKKDSLKEIVSWTSLNKDIAFSSSLIMSDYDTVIESGLVVGDKHVVTPFFYNSNIFKYGQMGGPLWYRNVTAASPIFISIKKDCFNIRDPQNLQWPKLFYKICQNAKKLGKRGMINPHARVYMHKKDYKIKTLFDDSFKKDPYFHPAFSSVNPFIFDEGK